MIKMGDVRGRIALTSRTRVLPLPFQLAYALLRSASGKLLSSSVNAAISAIQAAKAADARPYPWGIEKRGVIAQLGERFNGIEEVVGSIPSGSTS